MKDSRIGESLWFLWDLEESPEGSLVFYTEGHVDLDHEIVRKALASTIQREGVSYSLSQSFQMIDRAKITHGYSGVSPLFDQAGWRCDENGDTEDGYRLDFVVPSTWVEVSDAG